MSTPEQTPADIEAGASTEVETKRQALAALYDHASNPTRTTGAISWAGWHLGEIAGVAVPLGLALTVWDGFYALSGLAAACWAAHEVRLFFKQRPIRAASAARSTPDEAKEVQE